MQKTATAIALAGLVLAAASAFAQAGPMTSLPKATIIEGLDSDLSLAGWRHCWRDRWGRRVCRWCSRDRWGRVHCW